MKKLVLTGVLAALAVAAQAGDDKGCTDKDHCCAKTKTVAESKGECCMAKQAQTKSSKTTAARPVLQSPKALASAR